MPAGEGGMSALDRSQLLLRASTILAEAATIADVVVAVRHLVVSVLDPVYVGVSLVGAGGRLVPSTAEPLAAETALIPSALAVRTGVPVLLGGPDEIAATVPEASEAFTAMGWQSAAAVPLPGPDTPIGALVFVWKQPNPLDPTDRAVLAALAGYVAHAVRRALVLDDRRTAAATLQKALLTPLPERTGMQLAARYVPAHHEDHVGGDWYDAIRVDRRRMALVIGDVAGHDIAAAASMSQYRSILRALIVDRQEQPSAVLRRLERTIRVLGDVRLVSAVLAYLDPHPSGGHLLTWSTAGHPPPAVLLPDGPVVLLEPERHDPLLGAVRDADRRDHTRHLPPGSLLLLHTDGLVESRTATIDDGVDRLHRLLATDPTADVEVLADRLIAVGDADGREDDAALLVVRTPAG